MQLLTSRLRAGQILIVGDVILDRYWFGDTSRISPEAPVPVVRISSTEERPGGAGNVAVNVTALGPRTTLLGLTGPDDTAIRLQRLLSARQVVCRFAELAGFTTITKLRVLSQHQQLIRLDFEDHLPAIPPATLTETFVTELAAADVVVLSDYAKGCLREAQTLIASARQAGKPVLVDPKGDDFSRYRGATLITPNFKEFKTIVGDCHDEAILVEKAERLRRDLALEAVLVTRGEKGMTLVARDEPPLQLPAEAREVYDVTGAGDTVVAVLAAGLAAGYSLPQATRLANVAAGLVVAKLGAATVSPAELQLALDRQPQQHNGICTEDSLLERVGALRQAGATIVMTNGCFDILHAGHIHYLTEARKLGDRLIVAVNDDASVQRLKGASRPINPLAERMAVLAGLKPVDYVVAFSEDTPERLICRLKPDILVKGGDYRLEQIAGGPCVTAAGGRITTIPLVAGCSSSNIIAAVQRSAAKGREA